METPQTQSAELESQARSLVSKVKKQLGANGNRLNPRVAESINYSLKRTESALKDKDYPKLISVMDDLGRAYEKHLKGFKSSRLWSNVQSFLIAIILALFIRTFVVQPFKIPTGSMIPTLLVGDNLLVNKFIYGTKLPFTDIKILPGIRKIERGDVIVFVYPNYEKDPSKNGIYYIKRVVGLPGDSIDIDGRNLVINDHTIRLDYLGEEPPDSIGSIIEADDLYVENLFGKKHLVMFNKGRESTQRGNKIPVDKVPKGFLFVEGDNRDNSFDSRFWGFVPIKNVVGKAFIIHWSWNSERKGILDMVRWKRIGRLIK